jgi:hypothetical protein
MRSNLRPDAVAILMVLLMGAAGAAFGEQPASPIRRSVCQIDYFAHRLDRGELVSVEGEVISLTDWGTLLSDNRCDGQFVAIRTPLPYPPDSGIREFVAAIFGPWSGGKRGKHLHCICVGTLDYPPTRVVLNLRKVERIWFTP